jgi:type IV fimbrial biogenesis protein FimT
MRTRSAPGFTIIELMIVMVIVGVMVALAGPNIRDLILRIRLKTAASDLHSSLTMARSEAIKRNAGVQIVPVSAANWALGWSVQTAVAPVAVLSQQQSYPNVTFTSTNAAYTATAVANVTFSGTGRETGSAGAGIGFVIQAPGNPQIKARCVVLDPSGRAAVRQDADNNPANGCN